MFAASATTNWTRRPPSTSRRASSRILRSRRSRVEYAAPRLSFYCQQPLTMRLANITCHVLSSLRQPQGQLHRRRRQRDAQAGRARGAHTVTLSSAPTAVRSSAAPSSAHHLAPRQVPHSGPVRWRRASARSSTPSSQCCAVCGAVPLRCAGRRWSQVWRARAAWRCQDRMEDDSEEEEED